MKFSEMTNEQLAEEYVAYYQSIYQIECYGTKDLMILNGIEQEIAKRGGEIVQVPKVYFPEKEEIECECGKVFEGYPDKEDTCPDCLKKLIQGEN